jgi:pyrimidine-nucleoside phosphorylase
LNFVESIARKRDGLELSDAEVTRFVRGATDGSLADEQLAAMLMAICIRGASAGETQVLVEAMRGSGAQWWLGESFPGVVDKHSTGGVGDSVSLAFAPLVAACEVPVAMMAGAGLGHTQGTLDKLAAIPGLRPVTSRDAALRALGECGVCMAAQSEEIAPADRKLYALRDVTGTVPSLPLIVASIMSKKLAVGASALVLDVKQGSGAFCKTPQQAGALARGLLHAAHGGGMRAVALITDMEQPLGDRLGSASEVLACVEILAGGGDARLRELTVALAVEALRASGRSERAARAEVERALAGGAARRAYDAMVRAHGGDPDPARLARPRSSVSVPAPRPGYVGAIAAEELGWLAVAIGAGRRWQGDTVDFAAGLRIEARVGQRVEAGAPLATLELGEREATVESLVERAAAAFTLVDVPPPVGPLVLRRLAPGARNARPAPAAGTNS